MSTVGTVTFDLAAESAKLRSELDKAKKDIRGLRDTSTDLGTQVSAVFGKAGNAIALFGGVLSGAALAQGLVRATTAAIAYGDEIGKAAAKSGIGAQQFQALAHAARMSDVDMKGLSTSLRVMQVNVSEAASGGKAATAAFAALGVTAASLVSMRPEQQFELIADRISMLEDPADRARAATELFGRAGADLLPMFEQGAAGIRAATAEARALGQVLSDTDLENLQAADDAIKQMSGSVQGLTRQLSASLAPAITAVADAIRVGLGGRTEIETLTLQFEELTRKAEQFERRQSAASRPAWMGGLDSVRAADDAVAGRGARANAAERAQVAAQIAEQGVFVNGGGGGPRSRAAFQFPEAPPKPDEQSAGEQSAAMSAFLNRAGAPSRKVPGATVTMMRNGQLVTDSADTNAAMGVEGDRIQLEAMQTLHDQKLAILDDYNQKVIEGVDLREQSTLETMFMTAEQQAIIEAAKAENSGALMQMGTELAIDALGRQSKAGKAFGIAQATISALVAATNAFKDVPYPLNFAAAAMVLAAGLKNVQRIKSTNPTTGSGGGGGSVGSAGSLGSSGSFGGRAPEAGVQAEVPARAQTQIVVQGSIFSTKESADWFIAKVQEAVTDRDVTLFGPGTRQWQDVVGAAAVGSG